VQLPLIPDLTPYRVVWSVITAFFLLDLAMGKRVLLPANMKIEISMLLFCLYMASSGIIAGTIITEDGIIIETLLMGYIMPFSIYFFGKNIVDDEKKVRKSYAFFTIIGLYLGLTGIFEHFRLDFLVWPRYIMNPAVGIHFGQARGPFVQAGINGMTISLILFISTYLYLNETNKIKRISLVSIILIMMITLFFTYNRASWIGFIIASIVLPFFYRRLRIIYVLGVLAITIFLMVAQSINLFRFDAEAQQYFQSAGSLRRGLDVKTALGHRLKSKDSLYSRINLFVAQLRMINEKPLFGFGYLRFKKDSAQYFRPIKGIPFNVDKGIASQSGFMVVLVELGIVGMTIYLYLLYAIFDLAKKSYHILPRDGFLGRGIVGVVVGLFIVYLIGYQFREARTNMICNAIFFLNVGILAGLYERTRLNNRKLIH
jgi:O-antigen ligase